MKIVPFSKLKGDENPDEVIPIALLSLDDQKKRRENLKKREIPHEWVDNYFKCLDMRNADQCQLYKFIDEKKFESLYRRKILPAEAGCAMSHRMASDWLAASNFYLMIIIEDDVIPQFLDFEKRLTEIGSLFMRSAKKKKSFICHLGASEHQIGYKRKVYSLSESQVGTIMSKIFLFINPDNTIWYAYAYMISKAYALNSIDIEKKHISLADDWVTRRSMGIIDSIFYCAPKIFIHDKTADSTIRIKKYNNECKLDCKKNDFIIRMINAVNHGHFLISLRASFLFRYSKIKARFLSCFPFIIH